MQSHIFMFMLFTQTIGFFLKINVAAGSSVFKVRAHNATLYTVLYILIHFNISYLYVSYIIALSSTFKRISV